MINQFFISPDYFSIKCLLQARIDGDIVGAVEETSPSEAQALFDTNVFGTL